MHIFSCRIIIVCYYVKVDGFKFELDISNCIISVIILFVQNDFDNY